MRSENCEHEWEVTILSSKMREALAVCKKCGKEEVWLG